jgi:hypothetical protein
VLPGLDDLYSLLTHEYYSNHSLSGVKGA